MADILFDKDKEVIRQPLAAASPTLVQLAVRWGFAKDEKSAEYVLLAVVGTALLIMGGVLFSLFGKGSNEYLTPDELRAKNGFTQPIPVPR